MNAFGFRADQKMTKVIGRGRFTLSAEVIPPRNGVEQRAVLNQVQSLIDHGAQFLSVTKGAGGSLRGGSLPIAQAIKEQLQVPCIAHFTCRDLTPHEVENQLMDHHYFGIRNILALRGDPPSDQKDWHPKAGSHQYAYQLIEQIQNLNEGRYLSRSENREVSQERTDFCIGAAVYPEHLDPQERIEFFKLKVQAGAEYGITQMIFDADAYARFVDECAKSQVLVPVLPGTRILKSKKQALSMASRFQVSVPAKLLARLPDEATPETLGQSVDTFLEFIQSLKKRGAPGVHLFVLSDTLGACGVLKKLHDHYGLASGQKINREEFKGPTDVVARV